MKKMRARVYLLFLLLLYVFIPALKAGKSTVKKHIFTELFSVGIEEAKNEKEELYQFFIIANIDCDDHGNIYVLDYQARHVKKYDRDGIFIKKYFQQGKGPNEVANPFSISINHYTHHIFILQDFGYSLKEFDLEGNYINYYLVPKQFFGSFHFLNKEEFVFMNSVPKVEPFYNFLIGNITQRKIVKEFAKTNINHVLNFRQKFAVSKDGHLWTCPGNEMKLMSFDLGTGKKIEEIKIPGNYRDNRVSNTTGSGNMKMVVPFIYNTAQPFFIDNQLFTLLIINEYREVNGKTERFPIKCQRLIYQVNGSHFEKIAVLKDGTEMYYETVSKNRLILSANEPYAHFKVFEFKSK
jgi:hypothetical protein